MKPFYARGKLLLSSEYMVMYGANALSVPLQLGQSLHLKRRETGSGFTWKAFYLNEPWFHVEFNPSNLSIIHTSNQEIAERLAGYLKTIIAMNAHFQKEIFTWDVETYLEFHPDWGLGSSSSLTALLAEWAVLNPLDLHMEISSGSGYDVACAVANGPIVYRIRHDAPQYSHVRFDPPFVDQIWFAWLGNKQNSHESVLHFKDLIKPGREDIAFFNQITEGMLQAEDWKEFGELMLSHEMKLSEILNVPSITTTLFKDLDGYVKSLGAWGGDFVMIASEMDGKKLKAYLKHKRIRTIFPYTEIVQNNNVSQP